jgi:hypothetical protein
MRPCAGATRPSPNRCSLQSVLLAVAFVMPSPISPQQNATAQQTTADSERRIDGVLANSRWSRRSTSWAASASGTRLDRRSFAYWLSFFTDSVTLAQVISAQPRAARMEQTC